MVMRITGLTSGLDVDSIVTDSLKPYKLKIQAQEQQKQILEWKQTQYQSIMKKSTTFYNKYLDPTSSNNLFSTKNYNQTKFTSSNENVVKTTGSSNANIQDYSVTVKSLATKAAGKITDDKLDLMADGEKNQQYTASTTIGGETVEFQAKIGSNNESDNLNNFKSSINSKITELTDKYNTETSESNKKGIDTSLKSLYESVGKSFERSDDGTVKLEDIDGYSEDTLKTTMNNISIETNTSINVSDGTNNISSKIVVNLNGKLNVSETVSNYNSSTGATNVIAKYSTVAGGVVFEARDAGAKTLSISNGEVIKNGTNLDAVIKDKYGNEYNATGSSNTVTVDGVTYNFTGISKYTEDASGTKTYEETDIKGSQDVTDLKDKIVSFMKDYNELMGEINGKLWESYDSDYLPLTDDQREAMSDKQIEQWETKAQTGLLRKDDDLRTLVDSMKDIMSSLMKSTGLSLERIGITPVDDYKELNGTFEIDEEKLTSALQNNFEDIKDLFTKGYLDDDTSNAGIMPKMKELLNNNFIKFDSVFNKKAATGGVYALTNEMTKQITEKKKLIAQMNEDLNDRQESLYSKYSALETAMAEAQAQQSSMSSWFGTSS